MNLDVAIKYLKLCFDKIEKIDKKAQENRLKKYLEAIKKVKENNK